MSLVEQELPTLPGHMSSPPDSYWSTFGFLHSDLSAIIYLFFWPLYCMFFELQLWTFIFKLFFLLFWFP